jgi:hypothetical protein
MRQYYVNVKRRIKYMKILKKTPKAYLILMEPNIAIWVAKYMVSSFPAQKVLEVPNKYALKIQTDIRIEKLALKKNKITMKEQMSEIKNDVEEVAVIVTNQSSMPHGEQTIRWISKYNCYNKEGSTYQGGGEIKGYSGGYDVTIFYTDGTQIVLEGGLPYPEALRIAKKEKYKKKPTEEEVELTCCGDEITNLVKEIGLCPTCLEHI